MKIPGTRTLSTTGKRLAGMAAAFALSLAFAGDSYAVLRHNYLFNSGDGTTVVDSVAGGLNGTANGGTIDTADSRFVLDGVDNFVNFDGAALAINTYSALTLELWSLVSPVHEGQYTASVAFGATDAGGTGQQYIMMQPTRGGAEGSSGQITNTSAGGEVRVNATQDLSDGRIHHTVTTISATELSYYVDGQLIGAAPMGATTLAGVSTQFAFLGDSVWNFDPILNGALYEFRIYDDAKSATDVATLYTDGCQAGCGNLYLEIDRDTGAATLFNGLSTKNMVISDISSEKGALNPANWLSITNNYDEDNGGEFDPDDMWQIESATNTLLRELDPIGQGAEDGGAFGNNASIPLGNIWAKSPFEDFQVTLTVLNPDFSESPLSVPVYFVNGVNDAPYSRSDFDVDGDIDTDDYLTLRANHLKPLAGTLHIDTFDLGDINGDLANNYLDFRLFKADFIAANGAAAFASMVASLGAVPEPSTLGLLMLGLAAAGLASRRMRVTKDVQDFVVEPISTERRCTMNRVGRTLFLFALWMMLPAVSHAQTDVISESFDTPRSDLTGINPAAGTAPTLTLVDQGGGDNALQWTETSAAGGFFSSGFTIADLEVEPGPGGPNISSTLADYQLSFDLTINAINGFTPNLEIWLADGPRFGANNANLYTAGGLVNGVNNISFTLDQNLTTTTPNGFTSPGGAWSPTADNWWLQANSISFGAPAGASVDYTIDNIQVTIDIATSLALVVDPTSGKARIRNVSDAPIAMDYYRIESTNASLLTANFNGTTGWNSLDDQGLDSMGAGIGESWDEVVETNSASQLVEQFLLGETTLSPGQSVGLGAPVNPAVLNNQIGTLALRFGGSSFSAEGIGQVIFEDLSALLGDYNENGVVDAADYTRWRDTLGQSVAMGTGADGNNNGTIDQGDYNVWKTNFGAVAGAGSGDAGGLGSAVPEPTTFALAIWMLGAVVWRRRTL